MYRPLRSRSMADGEIILGDGSTDFPFSEEQFDCTQDGYYTDLLVNGVEQSPVYADPMYATTNEVPAKGKSSQGRGPKFSEAEDILLVSAWLKVSMDPITGVDQSQGTMWARIHAYYHENKEMEPTRSESSLLNRWSTIQHDVNLFCGCLTRIEARKKSGTRDTGKMATACTLFKNEDKKHRSFGVMHCWNILKDQPKWIDKRKEISMANKPSNKKQKTVANASPTSVQPAAPVDGVCDAQPSGRPARKKEKQKLRHGRTMEATVFLMEKKKEADLEREGKKEERCQKVFALQEERLKLERERLEFLKKEAEKAEKEEEDKIMRLDLSNLNYTQQQYYECRQKEILARCCNI